MRLHYREQGQGPPLIILHGLFGSLDNWAFISQRLSEDFCVLAVDLRNHGQSPHAPEMNYAAMAEDVRNFMEERQLSSTYLMGHSMGGKTAMQLALEHPELVDRLIVVDIAPRAYRPVHDPIFEALLALNLRDFPTRAEVEEALTAKIPDLATRRFLLKGLARNPEGSFQWKFNLHSLRANYASLNMASKSDRPFHHPTLFIRGENSDYIRDQDLSDIQRLFPLSEVVTIPGASHWVHAETPEIFLENVKQFLNETITKL
jgi:esterase